MAKPKNWTNDEIENLVEDFNKRLSYKELAKKYEVSLAAIRTRLYVMRKEGLIGKRKRD